MRLRCFISYRGEDEPYAAALTDRALVDHFGPGQVFRDSRTIPPGTDFPPTLWGALSRCEVFLAVIGQRWFGTRQGGRRLIDDPRDFVRREIVVALQRGIPVMPVLAGEVDLPRMDELPAELARLASRQYLRLRIRDIDYDLQRVIKAVEELTG